MSLSQYCTGKVKFISYDGKWPNLCRGTLILEVNDKQYIFESGSLSSGGSAYFTNNYSESHVESGEWSVNSWPKGFPKQYRLEAVVVINANISYGCCGGCL